MDAKSSKINASREARGSGETSGNDGFPSVCRGNTPGMSATPVTVLAKQRDGKLNRASMEESRPVANKRLEKRLEIYGV